MTSDTGDLFDFPDVRRRLTFTAEPAFRGSLALVVGVVQKPDGPIPAAQLRPLGDGQLAGHFHAAAFSFRPFKKGRLVLGDTVRTLFEDTGVQGVLHLLNDNRPVVGVGQSEFARGACWIEPIEPAAPKRERAKAGMTLLVGALTIGLILSLLALGVFISFRIFEFADITADGSITLGAAVAAVLLVARRAPAAGHDGGVSSRGPSPARSPASSTHASGSTGCSRASS